MEEEVWGFEAAGGDDVADLLDWQNGDVATVGGAEVFDLIGGEVGLGHQSQPDFEQFLIGISGVARREVGTDENAIRFESFADAAEERGSKLAIENEL